MCMKRAVRFTCSELVCLLRRALPASEGCCRPLAESFLQQSLVDALLQLLEPLTNLQL
jgi:hypothetical protein